MSLVSEAWQMVDKGLTGPVAPKLAKSKAKPTKPMRSEDYRRLVASVPCRYPGCKAQAPSQPCHLNFGKGKAMKVADSKIAAGCPEHHRELDQGKTLTRDERRLLLAHMVIDTYAYLLERGHLAVVEGA
jgi:hypothetical protein